MCDERHDARQFFRKRERIRARHEITKVFEAGKRWSMPGMRLHVLPTGGAENRAVFITMRKYGNAIARNRARRVVSECWRLLKANLSPGHDVIVFIYPGEDCMKARQAQMEQLVKRSGLTR